MTTSVDQQIKRATSTAEGGSAEPESAAEEQARLEREGYVPDRETEDDAEYLMDEGKDDADAIMKGTGTVIELLLIFSPHSKDKKSKKDKKAKKEKKKGTSSSCPCLPISYLLDKPKKAKISDKLSELIFMKVALSVFCHRHIFTFPTGASLPWV